MGTKEIAKTIREELKQFSGYKFSVVYDSYSMGSSITIALMQSPIKIIRDMEDISEDAIWDKENHRYTKEQIAKMQSEKGKTGRLIKQPLLFLLNHAPKIIQQR